MDYNNRFMVFGQAVCRLTFQTPIIKPQHLVFGLEELNDFPGLQRVTQQQLEPSDFYLEDGDT